jgi:hypothetical protein
MYYLFAECPDGDWELIAESRSLKYITKLESELYGQGIITCMTGW